MGTEFTSNTFEHDYIIELLNGYRLKLETGSEETQVTDKYAMALTSFMNGQILQAVKLYHDEEQAEAIDFGEPSEQSQYEDDD